MHSKVIIHDLLNHYFSRIRSYQQSCEEKKKVFDELKEKLQKNLSGPADIKLCEVLQQTTAQLAQLQTQFVAAQINLDKLKLNEKKADALKIKISPDIKELNKKVLTRHLLLWKEKCSVKKFFQAIYSGDINSVMKLSRKFSQATTDLPEDKESAVTALIAAIVAKQKSHDLIVEYFAQPILGMIDARSLPSKSTALHWAVRKRNLQDVKVLIQNKANPFLKDANEKTPKELLQGCKDETSKTIFSLIESHEKTYTRGLVK